MSISIPIYRSEIESGIAKRIQEERSVAYYCPIRKTDDEIINAAIAKSNLKNSPSTLLKEILNQSNATNKNQFDLHYLHTILTTTGWNKNEDIFDRRETWAARHTPEDKPFNFQHNPRQILGHMTGSCVVDENYGFINDDCCFDDLPDKFHILTSAVIYKHIKSRDEKLEEEMSELISEIASGKWMVSMEVLFSNFDYGVLDSSGASYIVERNENTAFLTKHLKSYGGSGKYQEHRVGRVMRNLTFSGNGLVDDPGNPESYILNDVEKFQSIVASFSKEHGLLVHNEKIILNSHSKEETIMTTTTVSIEDYNKSQQVIAELRTRLDKLGEEKVQSEIANFKQETESLQKTVADKNIEISNLQKALSEAEKAVETAKSDAKKSVEEVTADKTKVEAELVEAKKELEKISLESKATSRVSALVDKGVDKADAVKIVDKYSNVNDEIFEDVVKTQADLVEAKAAAAKKKEEDKKNGKNKEGKEGKEGKSDASSSLETEDEEGSNLSVANEEENEADKELQAGFANWFGNIVGSDKQDTEK